MRLKIVLATLMPFFMVNAFAQGPRTLCEQVFTNDSLSVIKVGEEMMVEHFISGWTNRVSYSVSNEGKISWIAYYNDDEVVSYSYFDKGVLKCTYNSFKSIEPVTSQIAKRQGYVKVIFSRCCQYTSYFPNGRLKERGHLVFDNCEIPEVNSFEYGAWFYYDEDGNLVETKFFD